VAERLDDHHVGRVAPDGAPGLAEERLLQRSRLGVEDGELDPGVAGRDVGFSRRRHCYRYWPVPLGCAPPGWPGMATPGGSAPWRICSSWARAAICWANRAV